MSAGLLFIALVTLSLVMAAGVTTPASAEVSNREGEEAKPDAEPAEGKRRPLQTLLQGANPEEHERLQAERQRISAAAKSFGTDPTAINGYYELNYGNTTFSNSNLRFNTMTAEVRLPVTPNWIVRATMPYVWADLDQTRGFTTNGASDMTVRTANRLYASPNVALLIGTDVYVSDRLERSTEHRKIYPWAGRRGGGSVTQAAHVAPYNCSGLQLCRGRSQPSRHPLHESPVSLQHHLVRAMVDLGVHDLLCGLEQ